MIMRSVSQRSDSSRSIEQNNLIIAKYFPLKRNTISKRFFQSVLNNIEAKLQIRPNGRSKSINILGIRINFIYYSNERQQIWILKCLTNDCGQLLSSDAFAKLSSWAQNNNNRIVCIPFRHYVIGITVTLKLTLNHIFINFQI